MAQVKQAGTISSQIFDNLKQNSPLKKSNQSLESSTQHQLVILAINAGLISPIFSSTLLLVVTLTMIVS